MSWKTVELLKSMSENLGAGFSSAIHRSLQNTREREAQARAEKLEQSRYARGRADHTADVESNRAFQISQADKAEAARTERERIRAAAKAKATPAGEAKSRRDIITSAMRYYGGAGMAPEAAGKLARLDPDPGVEEMPGPFEGTTVKGAYDDFRDQYPRIIAGAREEAFGNQTRRKATDAAITTGAIGRRLDNKLEKETPVKDAARLKQERKEISVKLGTGAIFGKKDVQKAEKRLSDLDQQIVDATANMPYGGSSVTPPAKTGLGPKTVAQPNPSVDLAAIKQKVLARGGAMNEAQWALLASKAGMTVPALRAKLGL